MPRYEYKVVPAPKKAGKVKGVKGTDNKFAVELSNLMNEYGAEGWEYQRTDTLPCEERQGLTGRTTTFQNMLVFRRSLEPVDVSEPAPASVAANAAAEEPVAAVEPEAPLAENTAVAAESEAAPGADVDAPPAATDATQEGLAVPTFRSAAYSSAPKLAATKDTPEGEAPSIAAQ